eukprot:288078-Rhodomonas_salina.2
MILTVTPPVDGLVIVLGSTDPSERTAFQGVLIFDFGRSCLRRHSVQAREGQPDGQLRADRRAQLKPDEIMAVWERVVGCKPVSPRPERQRIPRRQHKAMAGDRHCPADIERHALGAVQPPGRQ